MERLYRVVPSYDLNEKHMWEAAQAKITATETAEQWELEGLKKFDLIRWLGWQGYKFHE